MDDKLTRRSQEALTAAVRRSAADGSPQVESLHLLLALLEQGDGTTGPLLRAVGADPALIAKQAEERLARLPRARGATLSAPEMSRPLLKVISTAQSRAKQLDDEYISTEHLLVGLATDGGEAKTVLAANGATPDALVEAFAQVRGSARVTSADPEDTYKALEKYGVDLTSQARDGALDPVIGRDAEIRRVIQDQEQPGADRRARRRQDRRGRGPRPADRGRRRAGIAAGQAADLPGPGRHGGRRQVPR